MKLGLGLFTKGFQAMSDSERNPMLDYPGLGLSQLISDDAENKAKAFFANFAKAIATSLSATRECYGADVVAKDWKEQLDRIKILAKPSRNKRIKPGRKWNILHKSADVKMWRMIRAE